MKKKNKKRLLEALHYVILVFIGVFVAHWLSGITGIEKWAITHGILGWIVLFIWYLAFVYLTDKPLHIILGLD